MRILTNMTRAESEALLVLAPGAFIRPGVHCPHCRRRMDSQPEWLVRDSLIDWEYVCPRCGTVLDANLNIVSSLEVWGFPAKRSPCYGRRQALTSCGSCGMGLCR
jgi:hypothetical protein